MSLITLNRDPSRTTALRNRFSRAMRIRFTKLERLITKAIVTDDVLGLNTKQPALLQSPGRNAFNFPMNADKVQAFMQWLDDEIYKIILQSNQLEQFARGTGSAWTNEYIEEAYRRGVIRARYQLNSGGFGVPSLEATGGIVAEMNIPFLFDRLAMLYTRAFNDLKGITSAMDTQISRVLTQGLANGLGAKELAKNLSAVIQTGFRDSSGRYIPAERRAEMLARTEIIRAHAEGQLAEFKQWEVSNVTVKAEWVTAGDNRVCNQCADMERSVITLDEAFGMIPLHVSCRCAWVPYKVEPGEIA